MKKMSWGLYGLGMALLLTSCVAKKKYVEAQNRISQLEQQNANCVASRDSLNTSFSTLQQSNSALQARYDSSMNAYTTQRTTWNDYTSYYTSQKSHAEQMHQTLHQQLDDMVGANNIVLNNNKVYITLPESTLFTSGSTSLSSKGRNIVNTLATTIGQNPDVEVYVATTPVYGSDATAMTDMNGTNNNMNSNSSMSNSNNGNYNNNSANNSSSVNNNSSTTNVNAANGSYNSSTAKSTYHKPAAKKSYASNTKKTKTTYKSESSNRTMRSNYAKTNKPTSSSNSMAVARASTIVSALRQQGVQKAGIQVTDPVNRTSSSARKYQVIVSPTNEGYYEMMGKGNIGTGMK